MVDERLMGLKRLLLDDTGVIGRADWWLGTVIILAGYWLVSGAVDRAPQLWRIAPGITLFVTVAALILFYSVNLKRIRDRGHHEAVALLIAVPPAVAAICTVLRPLTGTLGLFDIVMGMALAITLVWMVIDLGFGGPKAMTDAAQRSGPLKAQSRFTPAG
jgi:uncharacterized membrane protein YhaH (DUF805 family)